MPFRFGQRLAHAPTHQARWTSVALAALLTGATALLGPAQSTERLHGIAMHGTPALAAGFPHFPYADPAAPRGGRLRLADTGSFDSLQPLIPRGVAPGGVREWVYESLMVRAQDEPFSLYGLIAESVELPEDRASATFHLRPGARFADGKAITAADVVFSLEVLKEKGQPFFRSYFRAVSNVEAIGERSVRFTFSADGNREIPLIVALMPILPSHALTAETFDRTSLSPPLGSGPYTVERIEAGRTLTFRRRADWWGRDLPVNRGRFNFDEIRVEFFREQTALFEALKTGNIDFLREDSPERWAQGYDFPAIRDGRLVRRAIDVATPAGMNALVFNTRRPLFQDPRVRDALIHLFDFEWVNRSLFHGLYTRTESYFARSALASTGRPADVRERALLAPFPDAVLPEVLAGTYRFPGTDGTGFSREHARSAMDRLEAAGYVMRDGRLVHGATGRRLTFEIMARNRAQERLFLAFAEPLKKLGIHPSIRQVDDAQFWARLKRFDFDMVQWAYGASLSPGNEQQNRWGSRAAAIDGSLNFAGVRAPAVDAMIANLLTARSNEDFTAAVRAFDRVLLSGHYAIPLFHLPKQWLVHTAKLRSPSRHGLAGAQLDTWWLTP